MNDRTSYLEWTLGFLTGVVAGAGAALLLAPQSGRTARDRVGRQLRHRARTIRALKERLIRRVSERQTEAGRHAEVATPSGVTDGLRA
jgi:gas vesicle protein